MSNQAFRTVKIGNEEYKRATFTDKFGSNYEYFVTRISANGKKTSSRLNPVIHRYAISRIEAAIQRQETP